MRAAVFLLLLLGFWLFFREMRVLEHMAGLLRKTRWDMEASARQRALEGRRQLLELVQENTFWTALERELYYSGIKLRFPEVSAELWIAGNLAVISLAVLLLSACFGFAAGVLGAAVLAAVEFFVLRYLRMANLKAVNEHMMKLLDFLGNYSITAGEAAGIFHQVGRYMEEPIKSALDACYYEAQTTGDTGLALLSMAEKIEHPKFKELARNMEISIRYCADFTLLVSGSRRSLREYLRVSQERKGMLAEAFINMALLLGMSLLVLLVVGYLVQMPAAELLTGTLPGRIGMGVLAGIGILFLGQVRKVHN